MARTRQEVIFERALYLVMSEYGYDREGALKFLNDDDQWNDREWNMEAMDNTGPYVHPPECLWLEEK